MEVLDVVLNGIQNDIAQVELISNNLANSNTPGYQRVEVFSQFLTDNNIAQTVTSLVQENTGFKNTDRALDIAITAAGYFLLDNDGDASLTRFGRFHVNPEGYLSHSSGALLMGEQGPISVSDENISVTSQGEVLDNGILVDRIQLVLPEDSQALANKGKGLYGAQSYQPVEAQVLSGAINDAGANTSADMVRLMELSRHTQSLQKAVYALDQITDAGINELGKR